MCCACCEACLQVNWDAPESHWDEGGISSLAPALISINAALARQGPQGAVDASSKGWCVQLDMRFLQKRRLHHMLYTTLFI